MNKIALQLSLSGVLLVLLCIAPRQVNAQANEVATGTPIFNSFGGGPFDAVNLGNLNVHFTVPVLHKQGRGLPFDFDLTYDSSIWSPVNVSGTNQWQPGGNWGWNTVVDGAVFTGYVYYSNISDVMCLLETGGYFYEYTVSGFVYVDQWGRSHALSGTLSYATTELNQGQIELIIGGCTPASYTSLTWGISGTTTDGSGISYSFGVSAPGYPSQGTTWNLSTTEASGIIRTPTFQGANTGSALVTDSNGNEITNDSSGHFYDTLSSTAASVTVTGAGSSTSPIELTYSGAGGSNNYTVNYTQYTVKTAFGDGSIKEYGPLSNPLISSIVLPDTSQYQFTYEKTPGSCTPLSGTYSSNCVTGRIASVTLPAGGTINYTYGGGYNGIETDGSTSGLTRTLNPGGEWQYSRALQTGSVGPGSTWTTTIIDPSTNHTVSHFAEDGYTTAPSYYFYETQRQIYQGNISATACSSTVTNNCLLLTTLTCYNAHYSGCSTASISSPITQTDRYSELPGQQPNGGIRLSEVSYNSYGLVTDDKEYDYGVTTGSAPGTTKLVQETQVSYASLTGVYNRPSIVAVRDWSSGTEQTVSYTTYSYDQGAVTGTSGTPQHTSPTGSRGNATSVSMDTSLSTALSKSFTYYDTGNPNVATDVNGAQTTYVYGSGSCGNSFPTTINEPMSLSKTITWNCTGGVTTQVTDENSNPVNIGYGSDPYWRVTSFTDQMGATTSTWYQPNPTFLLPMGSGTSLPINSNSSVYNLSYDDGLGRLMDSQVAQTPSSTTFDTVSYTYDANGRFQSQSTPCAAAVVGICPTAGLTYSYDALNRPLTVQNANSITITSYSYSNNDVLQAVSGGQTFQKQFEYDGLGRLTSVCEISSTLPGVGACGQTNPQTGYLTKYTYDAAGRLLTVTQNAQPGAVGGQQNRTFTYDLLGRMTQELNPETGTTQYVYDTVPSGCWNPGTTYKGDLVQSVKNGAVATCPDYDSLHRQTSDGTYNTCRRFVYDAINGLSINPPGTIANGKTQLTEVETDNCSAWPPTPITDEWFSYDKDGRLTDVYEFTPNSGGYYHSNVAYWPHGLPNTLSVMNKSGTALIPMQTYGIEGEGRPNSVTAASGTSPIPAPPGSPGVTYVTIGTSNWIGSITGVTYGSGDNDSFTTDPKTGLLTTYTFNVGSKPDTGSLNWNPNGTLQNLSISDQIHQNDTQNCTYAYDDVARVSSADCVNGSTTLENQTFTYDAFGNIKKSGTGTFLPTYVFPNGNTTNQFASIPGVTVSYDANGNLLTDNLNTYSWDPNYGNPLSVNTTNLTYDALGRLVEQQNGSTSTQILYSPMGKTAIMNGQTLTKAFVYLPGGGTAIYNPQGLAYYRHADWLGSSRLTSTKTQTNWSSSSYAPFGEQYATYAHADASFTGQNDDTVSSLYDFTFREYSPSQGRWVSPDPAGVAAVSLTNPQSWNRYGYVGNNPLSWVDPLGLCTTRGPCGYLNVPGLDAFWDEFDLFEIAVFAPGVGPEGADWYWAFGGDALCVFGFCGQAQSSNNGNCGNIPAGGETVPQTYTVQTGANSQMTVQVNYQFDSGGGLIGIGVQLTSMNSAEVGDTVIGPNTYVGYSLMSSGAVQFGFTSPVGVGSGAKQMYFQSATFYNGQYTSVIGAAAPYTIPIGLPNTTSSILQSVFNDNAQARSFGSSLAVAAKIAHSTITCSSIFGD